MAGRLLIIRMITGSNSIRHIKSFALQQTPCADHTRQEGVVKLKAQIKEITGTD
jgi:hypothetical protein